MEGLTILSIKSMTRVSTFFIGILLGPLILTVASNFSISRKSVELPKVVVTHNDCDVIRFKDQEKGSYFYLASCQGSDPNLIHPYTSSRNKALNVVDLNGFTR